MNGLESVPHRNLGFSVIEVSFAFLDLLGLICVSSNYSSVYNSDQASPTHATKRLPAPLVEGITTALRSRNLTKAFTLVELLTVVVIILVVSALALPAFNAIISGRSVANGMADVAGILEGARAEAMARRSYVYVGFHNVINGDGNWELRIGASIAPDGVLANTIDQQKALKPISKLIKLRNVKSVDFAELPSAVKDIVPTDVRPHASNRPLYMHDSQRVDRTSFTVGEQDFSNSPRLIFAPEGELLSPAPGMFTAMACVGLVQTRGAEVVATANDGAVVVVYGGTAQLRFVRP